MSDLFFVYDPKDDAISAISARDADRDWRHSDAGNTRAPFIVQARDADAAAELAREWVALWKDDTQDDVGDMALFHRTWRPGHTYAVLVRL